MTSRDLDSAGISGPVRAGYLVAGNLLQAKAKARGAPFPVRYLVSAHKRPYLEVLFAFITYLDDIVDDQTRSVPARNRRLDRLEAALDAAIEDARPQAGAPRAAEDKVNGALMSALVHFMRTWNLPLEEAQEYVRTQRRFLGQHEYATYDALEKDYLDPMAPPAIWANTFFEPRTEESNILCRHATMSFQLIDIIWDLREDVALGRLYLPLEHLTSFDLDRESVERQLDQGPFSASLCELLAFEVELAASLLASALDWPKTIDPAARPFVEWDIRMNRLKLTELRKGSFDDLVRRSAPGRTFKLRAAARTVLDIGQALNRHRGSRPAVQ